MSGWFEDQRIRWIGEIVMIYGFINREHICRKFDVSVPQASKDLQRALERFGPIMTYSKSRKRYELVDFTNFADGSGNGTAL